MSTPAEILAKWEEAHRRLVNEYNDLGYSLTVWRDDEGGPHWYSQASWDKLTAERDALKLEAQIHAQEARTANATIAECYRAVTGGTGEPGNWHGAAPVREALDDLRRQLAEAKQDGARDFDDAMRSSNE